MKSKRSGVYIQQSSGYKAFIPSPLPPNPPIQFKGNLPKLLSEADRALARLDSLGDILPNVDLFIAMFVRKEAVLSSQIEGTQASLEDLFQYESGQSPEKVNDVDEVVNYIKALNYGMERLDTLPMSNRLIREIHEVLLKGVRGAMKTPGEFKRTQNWIGPQGSTLADASFVPPPPHEAVTAMGELEKYLHRDNDYPALINCALIHYQFESIHPFLDGNGRLGRLLITFYLYWKGILHKPLLYLSYFFKKNRQEYYDRLTMVRNSGNYEQWIEFFLKGVAEVSDLAIETAKKILELQTGHRNLLWQKKISSPLAVGLLEKLFYTPYMSVNNVATSFSISYQAASLLVNQFEKHGILKETTGKKRDKMYVYKQYIDILSEGTRS
ncbi:MAG: Fic family protein [Syntrophaceae bacterium]